MTITHGYTTLASYKTYQRITSTDPADDTFIEAAIEAASRWIDRESGTQFYASTETRHYDTPSGNSAVLMLDADYASITSITNGDGSTIAGTSYITMPANKTPIWGVQLKQSLGITWLPDGSGNYAQAITVTGVVGYSAIPSDIALACLEMAKALYGRRFGENVSTKTIITPAGVVQIPDGVPDWCAEIVAHYRRVGFA